MIKSWVRVMVDISIFILILILPWYVSAVLLIGLAVYFPFYLELLFFGFVIDTLYSNGHIGLMSALVVLLVVMFIRSRIRR